MPTRQQILTDEENAALPRDRPQLHWLDQGVSLTAEQWEIRALRTRVSEADPKSNVKLERRREALLTSMESWLAARAQHMGMLPHNEVPDGMAHPEDAPLGLPSSYDKKQRKKHGLLGLAQLELKIREGLAHDLISSVKYELRRRYMLQGMLIQKKAAVTSVERVTRQNAKIKTSSARIDQLAEQYRLNRETMIELGMSPNNRTFREMKEGDLTYKDAAKTAQTGQGYTRLGWLWTHESGVEGDDPEWCKAGKFQSIT